MLISASLLESNKPPNVSGIQRRLAKLTSPSTALILASSPLVEARLVSTSVGAPGLNSRASCSRSLFQLCGLYQEPEILGVLEREVVAPETRPGLTGRALWSP